MTFSDLPFITICMPVLNEEYFIKSVLQELLTQNYPANRFEIIVADGESTDRTKEIIGEIACKYPQVVLINNPGRFSSSGRNLGFKNGRGDLFLVIDGHCKIDNDNLLRNVAKCFEKSNAQCVARPQPLVLPNELNMQRAIGLARTSWLGHSSKSDIYSNKERFVSPVSAGCAYKRQVFKKVGYVDESFDACEDVEFNYRVEKAGFPAFFSPSIAVKYHPRENLVALWKQLLRYGRGRFQFIFKHPETINLDTLLPAAFISGLALGPILGIVNMYFLWTYVFVLTIYCSILGLGSLYLARGVKFPFSFKIMMAFFCIHTALGIGMLDGARRKLSAPLRKIGHRLRELNQSS